MRLLLQFHELNKVAHGVIKNSDDGRPDIGGLHGELHALVTELLIFGFHIGGQELRDRNTVRLERCGIVFGGGMALRFQKQLGISLTFSIGNSKSPKIAVSYVILDSEAKGIDVKIVSAGNVVYRDGSDIYLHARHPSETEGIVEERKSIPRQARNCATLMRVRMGRKVLPMWLKKENTPWLSRLAYWARMDA